MKSFVTAMLIALFLVFGGVAFNNGINGVTARFLARLDEVEAAVINEDFARAAEKSSAMSAELAKSKPLLCAVINHENIDEAEECLSELCAYAESSDKEESAVQCRRLRRLLSRLPENYSVSAQNIL